MEIGIQRLRRRVPPHHHASSGEDGRIQGPDPDLNLLSGKGETVGEAGLDLRIRQGGGRTEAGVGVRVDQGIHVVDPEVVVVVAVGVVGEEFGESFWRSRCATSLFFTVGLNFSSAFIFLLKFL